MPGAPFGRDPVTLQYRPYQDGDKWMWYWVLHPEDGSRALAHGEADNRGGAAVAARKKARELNAVINQIDVLKPR